MKDGMFGGIKVRSPTVWRLAEITVHASLADAESVETAIRLEKTKDIIAFRPHVYNTPRNSVKTHNIPAEQFLSALLISYMRQQVCVPFAHSPSRRFH